MSGVGGGGVREVDDPSCQGVWGEPQENFLIQDEGGGYERWMTPLVRGCGGSLKKIF